MKGLYDDLVAAAIAALKNAYCGASSTRFGAAVLTESGNIYSSGQYFSETYTLTLHAEQAALAHAAAHGEHKITAIACVSTEDSDKEKYCHPCGVCKQLIYESYRKGGATIKVIMANLKGEYEIKDINEIISHPWPY
ncbi:MAG: cytidine deaminase [Candidatus Aenigmarchaeota archaeon]|nr:cytidine deaminase [Candidatus Aenigmarchaeota archaeon]